ncbi:MAG: ABC transporter permease [Planctomycetota bacterium]|nr:MAG: ABC transporter permease [Planctomycetota bacterium]
MSSVGSWSRLRRNRMAMVAAATVIGVVVACIVGPWVMPHDPSEQRPWLGAQAPLTRAVDAWQENRLMVGRAAEVPPRAARAEQLSVTFSESTAHDYAITLRRGSIAGIQLVAGGQRLKELHLDEGSLHLIERNGELGADLSPIHLQLGEQLPSALGDAGRRFLLRHIQDARQHHAQIHLNHGTVESITIDEEEHQRLVLSGDAIDALYADGRSLHTWHPLGTDTMGRDLLLRIFHGGRISLLVGLVATLVSVAVGVLYGLSAGYLGGRSDRIMMSIIDIFYAIPFLFLVILLLVSFDRSLLMLFIALGLVQWLTMARIIRGQALSLRNREFIEAARVSGASHMSIILRHLLPNCMGTVIVYATLTVPLVILQESFLAFIGLQVELADGRALDSWGALVRQGMSRLDTTGGDRWWLLLFPSLAMAFFLLAMNMLGDGMRDALDPNLRGSTAGGQR